MVHNGPTPFTVDVFTREVEYAFRHIATARDNESAWNYLRGLVLRSPSDVPGVAEKNSILLRCFDTAMSFILIFYPITTDLLILD